MTTKNKGTADGLGQEFTIKREFAAPRELVWKACTDAAHLAQWWGPKGFTAPVCEWDARPGNKIYVVMRAPDGTDFPMGGEFHEVVPPERLVTMTGALDEKGNFLFQFLHTMTLVEHNGKTKLTMHSRVIQVTPGAGRYIGGFETGMTMSLERLAEHLAQKTEPFIIERTFNAPVALVWQAITRKEDMKRWYFELEDFKPEAGFEFEFTVEHKGVKYCHRCKVTEVIPQKRLAHTWRYKGHPGDSLVRFDLFAEGNKTRVKLTHTGLETFPPTADFARENFVGGWTDLIGSRLKDFVESPQRTATGGDAAEMPGNMKPFVISREFDAPRELVWKAWTERERLMQWFGPKGFTMSTAKLDFRPGGIFHYCLRTPDGKEMWGKFVYREIVPPEKIIWVNSFSDKDGGLTRHPFSNMMWPLQMLSEATFTERDGKTTVTIKWLPLDASDEERRTFDSARDGMTQGWTGTFEQLANYLAKA